MERCQNGSDLMKRQKTKTRKFTYANFDNLEWVFDAARYSKKQALKIVQKEEGFTPEEMNDLEVREDWCKYCVVSPEWAETKGGGYFIKDYKGIKGAFKVWCIS